MGGGKDKKAVNNMITEDRAQNKQEHSDYMGRINPDWDQARARGEDMYSSMFGGYKGFIDGKGNFDPAKYGEAVNGGGGGGGGGDSRFGEVEGSYRNFMNGGGVDTGRFNRFQGTLLNLADTGGWDPARIASMDENIRAYKDIARTGGVDAEGMNRMRGGGVFDEFARTGGYSDADISNIRARATSVIPSFYNRAREEATRMGTVQGGYGPGRAALMSRLSRDAARESQGAALDAELGIKQNVNAGRQWGATGMSDAEGRLQSLLSSNRLAALTGASQTEGNMVNSIAQNRMGAASAGGSNETGMQGLIQQGKMFGTQGLEGMAESAAARSAAAAARASADAKWRAEFDREGQMFGLEGMRSLYGTTPAEQQMYINANLAGRGLYGQQQGMGYDAGIGNKGKGVDWAKIAGVAGTVALAASDIMLKTDIEPVTTENIIEKFKSLPIATWRYRHDDTVKHLGPMAQDMKRVFGVGDGHNIALVDVMGLLLLLGKAVAEKMEA